MGKGGAYKCKFPRRTTMSMSSDTLKVSWLSICTPLINVKTIVVLERSSRKEKVVDEEEMTGG